MAGNRNKVYSHSIIGEVKTSRVYQKTSKVDYRGACKKRGNSKLRTPVYRKNI